MPKNAYLLKKGCKITVAPRIHSQTPAVLGLHPHTGIDLSKCVFSVKTILFLWKITQK